ncbi:energy transducer TonB [Flammeovirga sp. OC4]|uniref:energy transducer TonB n=1 Tax=Flammeovirga sp. OC4 TaxID=1382345 RepID=UPI0009E36AEA|nr:energy transducer TonB [Flammeovirga sp. OC4]
MKTLLLLLIIVMSPLKILAQSTPEEISKDYIRYAYELLEHEEYDKALIKTDEIIALLPRTTSEIQYIRSLAHHHLNLNDIAKNEVMEMYNYPMTDELRMHANELSMLLDHEMKTASAEDSDTIYAMPETSASYPGGMGEFYSWFHATFESNTSTQKGKVFVEFIVNKYGKLEDIKILKGIDSSVDNKVITILKSSPKWMIAQQSGKPVQQKMVLPFTVEY